MDALHIQTGKRGESVAEKYLRRKRYRIIDRNVRTQAGEIDLIAQKKTDLIFVEVKSSILRHEELPPSIRVTPAKIERVQRLAQAWIDEHEEQGFEERGARIDIIGVCGEEVVEHYEDVTA